jgi:hypothetical protein
MEEQLDSQKQKETLAGQAEVREPKTLLDYSLVTNKWPFGFRADNHFKHKLQITFYVLVWMFEDVTEYICLEKVVSEKHIYAMFY